MFQLAHHRVERFVYILLKALTVGLHRIADPVYLKHHQSQQRYAHEGNQAINLFLTHVTDCYTPYIYGRSLASGYGLVVCRAVVCSFTLIFSRKQAVVKMMLLLTNFNTSLANR